MKKAELKLRRAIVDKARWMNESGLNQGTSGNISARSGDRMLITPSAVPYEAMQPEMLPAMPIDGEYGSFEGDYPPSTEWHFHLGIMRARPEVGAVVHTHSPYATALSMARKPIPACHYMIAAFGGPDIRCAEYAMAGTEALSKNALVALDGRSGCLLANHGAIAVGSDLDKAAWLAGELETIARQYVYSLMIGGPVILPDSAIDEMKEMMKGYGLRKKGPE